MFTELFTELHDMHILIALFKQATIAMYNSSSLFFVKLS